MKLSVASSMPGNRMRLFDFFMFSYLLLIPLTRQVPYHQLISFAGTALLLITYFVRKLILGSGYRFPSPLVLTTIGCYLFVILFSTFLSEYIVDGTRQLVREIIFFLIVLIVYDYMRSLRQWRMIVHALIWCGGIAVGSIVISAILLFFTGEQLLGGEGRVAGIFVNPNAAGLLISVCFPITIGYLQWKKYLQVNHVGFFMLLVIVFTLAGTILTVSRSLIIGFIFSMLALHLDIVWKYRYKLLLTSLSLLFIVAVLGIILIDADMLASVTTKMRFDRLLSGRGFLWERAWFIFQENPILGSGPSTYFYNILSPAELRPWGGVESIRYMYFQHGDRSLIYVPGIFAGVIGNSAHNLWLDTAANTGAVGVFVVGMIFVVFAYMAIKQLQVFHTNKQDPYFWIIRGSLVGLISFFLRSQFEPTGMLRGSLSESLPFWLTFLLVISAPQKVHVSKESESSSEKE